MSERKHFPTFVATFLLYGGLNHRIFRCLVFLCRGVKKIISDHNKAEINKSTPPTIKRKAVTAGNPTRAPWTEIVTQKMSYTRLKSGVIININIIKFVFFVKVTKLKH